MQRFMAGIVALRAGADEIDTGATRAGRSRFLTSFGMDKFKVRDDKLKARNFKLKMTNSKARAADRSVRPTFSRRPTLL
jgi:hypothetical protein